MHQPPSRLHDACCCAAIDPLLCCRYHVNQDFDSWQGYLWDRWGLPTCSCTCACTMSCCVLPGLGASSVAGAGGGSALAPPTAPLTARSPCRYYFLDNITSAKNPTIYSGDSHDYWTGYLTLVDPSYYVANGSFLEVPTSPVVAVRCLLLWSSLPRAAECQRSRERHLAPSPSEPKLCALQTEFDGGSVTSDGALGSFLGSLCTAGRLCLSWLCLQGRAPRRRGRWTTTTRPRSLPTPTWCVPAPPRCQSAASVP